MEQQEASPMVFVDTLGEFFAMIDGKTVDGRNHQLKKAWILPEYLLTFRNREVSPEELMEFIWKNEDLSNPSGAFRTLMFRVCKSLVDLDYPPQMLILQQHNSYSWNRNLNTIMDADTFEALVDKGIGSGGTPEEWLDACLQALGIYERSSLPKSSYEPWMILVSTCCHSLYQKAAHTTIRFLMETEDYIKIVNICQKATSIEPCGEGLYYHLAYTVLKGGQQQAALEYYSHTIGVLYSESAIMSSEHLKSLHKIIRDTKYGVAMGLGAFRAALVEKTRKPGVFFCECSVFRGIRQLESRSIERTGDPVYLRLLTPNDLKRNLLSQSFLNKEMGLLGDSIRSSPRHGDVSCRYSVSQFMLLPPTATYENGEMMLKRITRNFHRTYTRRDMIVNYLLQAVVPAPRKMGDIINI